jgi:hypothetical protein
MPELLFVIRENLTVAEAETYTFTATAIGSGGSLSTLLNTEIRQAVHFEGTDVPDFTTGVHANNTLHFSINGSTPVSRLSSDYATMSGLTIQSFEVEPLSWGADGAGNMDFQVALRIFGH